MRDTLNIDIPGDQEVQELVRHLQEVQKVKKFRTGAKALRGTGHTRSRRGRTPYAMGQL